MANDAAAQAGSGVEAKRQHQQPLKPKKQLFRSLALLLIGLIAIILIAMTALWWWAGTEGSLASAIRLVQKHALAPPQQLSAEGVTGSLRAGGQIKRLRWQQESLTVDAEAVSLAWQPLSLLGGALKLERVAAASLLVNDQRPPSPPAARPPDSIRLPIGLTLDKFSLGRFSLIQRTSPDPVEINDLSGRYDYNGQTHQLDVLNAQAFGGRYSGRASLTDTSPLQLNASFFGGLALSVPGGSSTSTLPVTFQATAQGLLTELSINATAQTSAPGTSSATSATAVAGTLPHASLTATVTPWAAQPLPRAEAAFNRFNIGALWPQAPQTLLSGTASVRPLTPPAATGTAPGASALASQSWAVQMQLANGLAGPIDQQRLPLDELQASAQWQNGVVTIQSLKALTAGGELLASGTWAAPVPATGTRSVAPSGTSSTTGTLPPTTTTTTPSSSAGKPPSAGAASNTQATPPPAVPQAWKLQATLKNINPAKLHTQLAPLPIGGETTASSQGESINFSTRLQAVANTPRPARSSPLAQLRLQSASASGSWNPLLAGGTLTLSALRVRTDDAELAGQIEAQIVQPGGKGNLTFTAPGLSIAVQGEVREKTGGGDLDLRLRNAAETVAWAAKLPGLPPDVQSQLRNAAASGNAQLSAQWQGGWTDPVIQARLSAPVLDLQLPTRETQVAVATAASTTSPNSATSTTATAVTPATPFITGTSTGATEQTATVQVSTNNSPIQALRLRDVQADLSGRLSQARLSLRGRAELNERRLRLQMAAELGQVSSPGRVSTLATSSWQGLVRQFEVSVIDPALSPGSWSLGLRQPVTLRWTPPVTRADAPSFETGAGEAVLNAPTAKASSATIAWQPVRWANNQLTTAGKISGLPMAWAELIAGPQLAGSALSGDLVFDGQWDARLTDSISVKASLVRRSGDITVQAETSEGRASRIAAGVRQASVSLVNEGEALALALVWDSERAGSASGELKTRLTRLPASAEAAGGWTWAADAPLDGQLRAQLPRIGVWSVLAPPGWRIQGSVATQVAISGNRAGPLLSGTVQADGLALRSVVDGIEFGNGRLRATLDGTRMRISEFSLQGAAQTGSEGKNTGTGGMLMAQGEAAWLNQQPSVRLDIKLDRLRGSIRTDRQITLSGALQARLEGKLATLNGALKVDQARIVLPEEGTPQLGNDVVVRSSAAGTRAVGKTGPGQANASAKEDGKASPAAKSPDVLVVKVSVELDLGTDFRVQGKGIDTQLRGTLLLAADSLANPRLNGEIRTVGGQYRAYGQRLDVEQGIVRFTGRIENPTLDILAIRPNLTQRVGVQIQGTALLPRVRLYAEPDLPDAEKLSWLVLGRSSASGGGEAALLQQAAAALLGSKAGSGGGLAGRFGLDELSYGDASGGAGGSAVTLGKRFSNNFYAAYERSISGAVGTLFVFYDLSKRFTIRAQAGSQSAVDLIFTVPFD